MPVKSILGQQYKKNGADTIVVYETIVIYDTLHVYDTQNVSKISLDQPTNKFWPIESRINNKNLGLGSGKLDELKKNDSALTSFIKSYILFNENRIEVNKKQELSIINSFWYYKKIGIILGGGAWWTASNTDSYNSRSIYSSSTGLFMEGVVYKKLMLRFELYYCHLYPDFFFSFYFDDFYSEIDGTVDSLYQFNQITLPVKLSYRFKDVQLYTGLEYSFRLNCNYGKQRENLGLCLGGYYCFSDRFSIGINYSMGFARQHDMVVYMKEDFFSTQYIEKYNGKGNSRMIDFSLCFNLIKN